MKLNLKLSSLESWAGGQKPLIISGPCGAESREQVLDTAKKLKKTGRVQIYRAGIWKPRTRPNSFEGAGNKGLDWLKEVKKDTGLLTTVEVATREHVRFAIKAGVDILWLGARTTVSPFAVQEIADELEGIDIPVMVKNPIHPDIHLWIGALERLNKAGVTKLSAIHRGFFSYENSRYRNIPEWHIPIDLKMACPELPIFCDPSHICGNKFYLEHVAQKALDLDFQGLMIESHTDPASALSDKEQQITPEELNALLDNIIVRQAITLNSSDILEKFRNQIDRIDEDLIKMLGERIRIVKKIGLLKKENNITILQLERWMEILKTRSLFSEKLKMNSDFIKKLLQLMHKESIRVQEEIMNENREIKL